MEQTRLTSKANSLLSFKNSLLKLGRPVPNSYFHIHNPVGLKLDYELN